MRRRATIAAVLGGLMAGPAAAEWAADRESHFGGPMLPALCETAEHVRVCFSLARGTDRPGLYATVALDVAHTGALDPLRVPALQAGPHAIDLNPAVARETSLPGMPVQVPRVATARRIYWRLQVVDRDGRLLGSESSAADLLRAGDRLAVALPLAGGRRQVVTLPLGGFAGPFQAMIEAR